jgi:hypothetical protein
MGKIRKVGLVAAYNATGWQGKQQNSVIGKIRTVGLVAAYNFHGWYKNPRILVTFAGFALVLVLQAIFAALPINAPFVALVFVIGAISLVLLVLFARGVVRDQLLASLPTV